MTIPDPRRPAVGPARPSAPAPAEMPTRPLPLPEARTQPVSPPASAGVEELQPRRLLEQMGGWTGIVLTAVPSLAYSAADALGASLVVSVVVALATGVGAAGWRLLRGEPLRPVLIGLGGVALSAAIALLTGSAGGYFYVGIFWAALGALGMAVTLVIGRPVTGMLWNAIHGGHLRWRADRPTLVAHHIASGLLTAVFAFRAGIQVYLLNADAVGAIGIVRVATGYPLLAVSVLVVIWAFRRSTRRLIRRG